MRQQRELVVRGGSDGAMVEKGGDLRLAEALGVAFTMEKVEAPDPVDVGGFGADAVALDAQVPANALTKPDMTGEWEYKLRRMEHGKFQRDAFMDEIKEVTRDPGRRSRAPRRDGQDRPD